MTLILEFERKLIFYKPGILRYAMRQAGPRLCMSQTVAQRRQLLSLSLKRGWAEARAELAALQRLQTLASEDCAGPFHNRTNIAAAASQAASRLTLGYRQLH